MPKKLKLIGCKVLMRELYRLACDSPNVVDIAWKSRRCTTPPTFCAVRYRRPSTPPSVKRRLMTPFCWATACAATVSLG